MMIISFNIQLAFFLLSLSTFTYSQQMDSLKSKRIVITTSAFEYLPSKLNSGNFNLGTEVYLKNRKSLFMNVGIIKPYGPSGGWLNVSSLSTQGIKIQVEGRHYLNKHQIFQPAVLLFWPHIFQYKSQTLTNTGYYVAVHSSFQSTSTDRQERVLDYVSNTPVPNTKYYKKNIYTVDRSVYAVNIKFGYQCIKKHGLTIDHAAGLGVQYISSSSRNKIGTDDYYPNSQKDIPWNKLFNSGVGIYPNLIYQFRLGWAF